VTGAVVDEFINGIGARYAPLVIALDRTIRDASPGLDCAIKYRLLTHAVGDHYPLGLRHRRDEAGRQPAVPVRRHARLLGDPTGPAARRCGRSTTARSTSWTPPG
jgi:hypothetical protein